MHKMRTFQKLGPIVVALIILLIGNCEASEEPEPVFPKVIPLRGSSVRRTSDEYNNWREAYMAIEESKALGADLSLSPEELRANQIIMEAKTNEYQEGLSTPHKFAPSQHLFEVLDKIKSSHLFKIISKMPKGGVLHAHDTALCSTDFVLDLTYRDDLWVCQAKGQDFFVQSLKFSRKKPDSESGCNWDLMADVRKSKGAEKVDKHFRERLTLYPKTKYEDNNEVWRDFINIFGLLDGLLFYAPVWADYYYNALKEFQEDGVQYLEFRTTLPILYDMDGTKHTPMDTVRIYNITLTRFKQDNPDFIGSKLIYAPLRHADDKTFQDYKSIMNSIKDEYPHFVAGFDLVGQEEKGRPLIDFVPELLTMRDDINFYFHAGETNWFGASVDENLIDAVLLGTKRIGHGFAVIKHPYVLQMIKDNSIAVELNPLSNQVLQLVGDLRNHPGAFLFADDYPVVVSSDDPSFWKATPLSHDFYVAFLGIASAHADIRLLKKLAMNSINFSAMEGSEKNNAMSKWKKQWDKFIKNILNSRRRSVAARRLHTNQLD